MANEPEDVLVIDGGSTDDTVRIAASLGVRVIEAGPIGLARQRKIGYQNATTRLVAFVDADDRLEKQWLKKMVEQFDAGAYAALQSELRVPEPNNFWTHGWNEYFRESVRPSEDTIMVGRPSLYSTAELLGISSDPGMIIEDTEMSRDFQERGLRQGIGTAISYRYCPAQAQENIQKWQGYGRGYRQFVTKFPQRKKAIMIHLLWTIPVSRSVRPLLRGHVTQPLFGFVMGSSALVGYLRSRDAFESA